jgi:hypothetical protein
VGDPRLETIDRVFAGAIRAHEAARGADHGALLRAIDAIAEAFRSRRRLLVFGKEEARPTPSTSRRVRRTIPARTAGSRGRCVDDRHRAS